jgi:putative Holliday junction resolvase
MTDLTQKTLALDYGTRRIGVAIQYGTLAEPLEVIGNRTTAQAEAGEVTLGALNRIKTLCQEHKVTQILIGLSEGEMAAKSQKFGNLVQSKCQLPVIYWDETLSSITVAARLRSAGQGQRLGRGPIDQFAAAVILEDWLDCQ